MSTWGRVATNYHQVVGVDPILATHSVFKPWLSTRNMTMGRWIAFGGFRAMGCYVGPQKKLEPGWADYFAKRYLRTRKVPFRSLLAGSLRLPLPVLETPVARIC